MSLWEPRAEAHLDQIADSLERTGALDLLRPIIAHVWAGNVDRFDPQVMGDTNGSIGYTASENISTLTRRRWRDNLDDYPDLRADDPDHSLLLTLGSIRVHPMKAGASVQLVEPDWVKEFNWGRLSVSNVRHAAATANTVNRDPYAMPGTLFTGTDQGVSSDDLAGLRETFLVWAGGHDDPATAGWLGLPVLGEQPWLAVKRLWWDQPGSRGLPGDAGDAPVGPSDTFTDRDEPKPQIRLKPEHETGHA